VVTAKEDRGGSMVYVCLLATVAALGGLMFGYDTAVIAGAIDFLETRFALSPFWKGWAVSSVLVGCMIGAALAGPLSCFCWRPFCLPSRPSVRPYPRT